MAARLVSASSSLLPRSALDCPADPHTLGLASGVAALALAAAVAAWLIQRARAHTLSRAAVVVYGLAIAAVGAYGLIYVAVSCDLMVADFIRYRENAVTIAEMVREDRWSELIGAFLQSMGGDYSWVPAFLPGLALAATAPLSRLPYQASLVFLYGAPALVALATLATTWRAGPA